MTRNQKIKRGEELVEGDPETGSRKRSTPTRETVATEEDSSASNNGILETNAKV